MMRCLMSLGAAMTCGWASSADVLVDFARESGDMKVTTGAYVVPGRQRYATEDGLTLLFDSAQQTRESRWATLAVPKSVGGRIDWMGRRFVLVLKGHPQGRAKNDIALNFEDRDGETFQIFARQGENDADGNLRLHYDVAPQSNAASGCWGGGAKANRRTDPPMRFTAVNVHFSTLVGDGSIQLIRIESEQGGTAPRFARTVETHEAISTDTMYPGAKPFHGAEELTFEVTPAFTGTATLVLSTESVGSAAQGRMVRISGVGTNGIVRFKTAQSYDKQYQFMRIESASKEPLTVTRAEGRFRQTAAEAMRLAVDTKNELHIVRDASERPELVVTNPARRPIAWKTVFDCRDVFGRTFEVPFDQTVPAGGIVRVALPWPLPAKGLWRVRAKVAADDGSEALHETRFAFIDRHDVTPKLEKPKFRMGIHYHGTHYWPDRVDTTIAALVAAGAKFTRCDYDHMWADIERRPGEYDWTKSDAMIEKLRAAGLALDIIMFGEPHWAKDPAALAQCDAWRKAGQRVRSIRLKPGLFRAFCEKYGRRYGTQIDYYEIGNELDLTSRASLPHDAALDIQREAYEGLHAGNRDVCVIPNGWAYAFTVPNATPDRWNVGLIEAFADHPELYDAWAIHCHGSFEQYAAVVDGGFSALRARSGLKTRPWLSNETALTSAHGEEDTVARNVWMKILFAWSRGARDYIWYNLRATGWFDGGEPGYGLITADFHPRAGYAAFAALTTVFEGLDFNVVLHSEKLRHLFRFKGQKDGFSGMVLAGWDVARASARRNVRIRTDAVRAELCDHMGNRFPAGIKDGVVVFPIVFAPYALLLHGATKADVVDAAELTRDDTCELLLKPRAGTVPTFTLASPRFVKDVYQADPSMVRRIWAGPGDHAASVWLERTDEGTLHVKAKVVDDVRADGDGVEVFITGRGGQMKTFALKPVRRDGNVDVYDAVLPVAERSFGFDVHVLEDDGEGPDGYLQLRNESEGPLCVRFE